MAVFFRAPAVRTKSDTSLLEFARPFGSTATSQTCWAQFVSDTLDVNQTITGTVSMVVRTREESLSEDAHLAFSLRVITPALAVRGTLKLQHATATEFAVTAQTRIHSAVVLTSVAALAGDYLVMEIGIHGVTPANAGDCALTFGDPVAVADFALTSGLTTNLCPWFELSQNLTFGTPGAGPPLFLWGGLPARRRNFLRRL